MHSLNNEHIFSLFKEWTFVSRKLYFCIVVFPQCQFLHFHFPPFTALINVLQLYFLTFQYFASSPPLLCSARIYTRTFPAPLQSKVLICNFSLNSPTPFLGHVSPSSCPKKCNISPLASIRPNWLSCLWLDHSSLLLKPMISENVKHLNYIIYSSFRKVYFLKDPLISLTPNPL